MAISAFELAVLLAGWWCLTAVYVAAGAIVGVGSGLALQNVYIGVGPTLARFSWLGGCVHLRPIPVAGSAEFGAKTDVRSNGQTVSMLDVPVLCRACVLLAGPLSSLLIGATLVAVAHVRSTALVGILGIWFGIANLLPLPVLSGGILLLSLFPQTRCQRIDKLLPNWVLLLSAIIFVALQAVFLWMLLMRTNVLLAWFDR